MTTQFKSLITLLDYFKDEAVCKEYYEQVRWGGNVACPHCNCQKVYRTTRGFKCSNKTCYNKFTVTIGTIFENSKVPLRTWFAAMYLITSSKKGISSVQLSKQLDITQKTAWFLLHRIREMLKRETVEELTGNCQVDESYFGGKNKNKHKAKRKEGTQGRSTVDKTPIVGIFHEETRSVKVFVTPNTEADVIHPIVEQNLSLKDAVLITDSYKSYVGLGKTFPHIKINHSAGIYTVDIEGHRFTTNNIENFLSIFKRGYIGIYHYMSPKHLRRYGSEFTYRYNT